MKHSDDIIDKITINFDDNYISMINNSEFYRINKALTDMQNFSLMPLTFSAEAHISDSDKDILIEITQYDIIKNPGILMEGANKEDVLIKVSERLNNLDQNIRDTYLILFHHWFFNKIGEGMENEGNVYLEIEEIFLKYQDKRGKNPDSTLRNEQYEGCLKAIDILANTRVKIDITKDNNVMYDKIKSLGLKAIEGFLINDVKWAYNNNDKIIGIWYNLGLVGQAYTKHIPHIRNTYPKAIISLEQKKYATVKNISNYFMFLYERSKEKGEEYSKVNFFTLIGESGYEIKNPRIQEGINRFLKNLKTCSGILIQRNIVNKIYVPVNITSKNYKNTNIKITWNFNI